jgi:hypothetical protein
LKFSSLLKAALALSIAASAVVSTVPVANAITFQDVEKLGTSDYHVSLKESIYSLANRGIVNGVSDTKFDWERPITRAEASKIIANAMNYDLQTITNPKFSDVASNAWYYPYVAALANRNIISGYNGKFNPNAKITRGDMAKILAEAFSLKASSSTLPFSDIPAGHYSIPYVAALFTNNITKGVSPTSFGYKNSVKRGDLAIFILAAEKAIGKEPTPSTPVTDSTSLTVNASDYGFKSFNTGTYDQNGVFKQTASSSSIKLEALKEGQGKVLLKGTDTAGKAKEDFYLVNVETVNNKLVISLEKANMAEYIDYNSVYFEYKELGITTFTPAVATLRNSSNVAVNDLANIYLDTSGFDISISKAGTYKLTLENGANQKVVTVEVTLKNFETKIEIY